MSKTFRKLIAPAGISPCFYCGVDSTALKVFLISLIGMGLLGSFLLLIGMMMRQKDRSESIKYDVLIAETRGDDVNQ